MLICSFKNMTGLRKKWDNKHIILLSKEEYNNTKLTFFDNLMREMVISNSNQEQNYWLKT